MNEDEPKQPQLIVRQLRADDVDSVVSISEKLYAHISSAWSKESFDLLMTIFPEGQIGVESDGKIVAFAFSLIVDYKAYGDEHTYMEITGDFEFSTHDAEGDVLYGIEVCVDPEYQGMRLGRRLYDTRKEICERLNLRAIIAGGRMPNYKNFASELKPKEYLEKVRDKEIYDPVMTFQLSNDFHVKKVLTNYLDYDTDSKAYATLLEWNNIYYAPRKKLIGGRKVIRLGVVQLEMRTTPDLASFFEYIEFFIDAVSGYKADFIHFPEYVNAPLMAKFNKSGAAESVRKLAEFTPTVRDFFLQKAVEYNINIITGSMPYYEDGKLFSIAYLCRRDGTFESQYKLHITPSEQRDWGMVGGDKLQVFETDAGRVAILICYDVEFPELGRILAEQGVQILFVPFASDTKNGYLRVRHCAQARAIENECYVSISGSVGNLPKVVNMDIQYAQSAVFSPSDFAFPYEAIVSESTINTEATIIADVDLDLLKHLHSRGSVKNLMQRRHDLYSTQWLGEEK